LRYFYANYFISPFYSKKLFKVTLPLLSQAQPAPLFYFTAAGGWFYISPNVGLK
jgi:hypothetical protein